MQSTTDAIAIGDKAPDFSLLATDAQTYSLGSFDGSMYLTVVFLANHCPYVASWEDRLIAVATDFADRGVAFAAISSNDATRIPADSFDAMRVRVGEKAYPFPYLYDREQSAARSYGASRTPEVFVFDRERHLRYHGAIDSDWEESPDVQPYLRDALEALLDGGEPDPTETRPVGCTLKLNN